MPRVSRKAAVLPAHVTPTTAPAVEFKDLTRQIQRASGFPEALAALKNGRAATIDGAWGSAAGLISAALGLHAPTTLVIVLAHISDVDDFRDDIAVFAGITPELLPAWEKLPREQDASDEVFGKRLRVISRLAGAMPPRLIVTSIQALLQPVPRREVLVRMSRRIGVGDSLPVEELASWLLERGMMRSEVVEVPGEFSLRGGIFDVFPTDATEPVRIEFFGDEVESIRPFDAESQRSLDRWDNVTITIPPSYDEKNRASFGPPTDFFPGGTWVALIEPGDVREEGRHYLGRIDDPRGLYSVESTFERLIRFPSIAVSALAADSLEATCHLRIESVERFSGDLARVKAELDGAAAGDRVLIACHNAAEVERLGEVFSDTILAQQGRLHRAVGRIRAGFHLIDASTLVIADHELFARADVRRPVTRRRYESRAIDSFLDLNEGDLVVHVNHGIARYRGLQFVDQSAEHAEETLLLEFAEGTKLYVPIAKIDLVQKYVGGGKGAPVLSKIGSSTWEKRKKRVAEAVVDLAQELLDIHAQRACQPGFAYPAEDSHWMAEFEAAFPFEETPDQLTAIEAIKHDMAEQKPMDRLICGDVGYGKTEIAIRAAFKAVDAGKQVAVLVPTTILAEQHHRSFSARMGEFPFHIEVVNRFRPRSEVREVLKRGCRRGRHPDRHSPDPAEGRRVQGPGAGGHRRGAAVRGRGQGVAEDLPFDGRRTDALGNADSADPAHEPSGHPRHLQPGDPAPRSQGDRDQDQSVRSRDHQAGHPSRAEPRRPGLLRAQPDLRHRERRRPHPVDRSRGADRHRPRPDQRRGPRAHHAGVHSPQVRHPGRDHDHRERPRHPQRQHDLHQRGRQVRPGRPAPAPRPGGAIQAPGLRLSSARVGQTRHAQRGSAAQGDRGVHLAGRGVQDRAARPGDPGAGNILGPEQSGHIESVGYELYCSLLESAVRSLTHQPAKPLFDCSVELSWRAYLPKDYVPGPRVKLELYRRLARLRSLDHLADFRQELNDRFGPLPRPSENLLLEAELRILAGNWKLERIHVEAEYVVLTYRDSKQIETLARRHPGKVRIVDPKRAYVPLGEDPLKPPEIAEIVRSLLRTKA